MLLPSRLASASSGALSLIAATEVASSGSVVLIARNWVPTKLASQFMASARPSPVFDSTTPAMMTTAAEARYPATVLGRLDSWYIPDSGRAWSSSCWALSLR